MQKVGKILGQLGHGQSLVRHSESRVAGSYSHSRDGSAYQRPRGERGHSAHGSLAVANGPSEGSAKNNSEQGEYGKSAPQQPGEKPDYAPRRRRSGVATDLTRVKSILSKVLSHRGLDRKVERYEFILHWHKIVGERLAEVSKPECIVNQRLMVNVLHPAWAQELTMIKPVLLESLAQFLRPGDVVRDMVFRVKPFVP